MSLSLSEAYQILELDPDAPLPEVRRSYRDLAQVWHPDRFAHSPRLQEKANRKLARINAAHSLLVDRLQRPAILSSEFLALAHVHFCCKLLFELLLKVFCEHS